jgi:hypothetical protein
MSFCSRLLSSGEKFSCTDHELFPLALQHDRSLAGRERGPTLNHIRFALEGYPLPGKKAFESLMVLLRIDFFHDGFHTTSPPKA